MAHKDVGDTKDIIDSLKLECQASNNSPESRILINQVNSVFFSRWKKYIPLEKLESVKLSTLNPIETDSIGMKTNILPNSGLSGLVSTLTRPKDVDGQTERVSGIGIIKLYSYQDGLNKFPQKELDSVISLYELKLGVNYNQARQHFAKIYFQSILAHEFAHVCSRESIPNWFREIGARYYQHLAINDLYGVDELQPAGVNINHDIYNKLLNRFGDNLHNYFFGNVVDSRTQREIIVSGGKLMLSREAKEYFTIDTI